MGFGDLHKAEGVKALDKFLEDKSYIEGFQPSQADVAVYQALSGAPSSALSNALRWYKHISSYAKDLQALPGVKQHVDSYGPATAATAAATKAAPASKAAPAAAGDDDDDFELFGSDEEQADEEADRVKAERLAAYEAKKSTKAVIIAKSNIVLDVKPWDDETDMAKLEECVRSVQADGLLWGASKLVPLAYGIKKLQITCVVEDDKVGTDFLEEEITKYEDYIQSVDIAAFNKI
jgi:elongation factor 1-beta